MVGAMTLVRKRILCAFLFVAAVPSSLFAIREYRLYHRPLFSDFIKDGDSLVGLFLPWYENEPIRSSGWIGFFDLGRNMIVVFNADDRVTWDKLVKRHSEFDVEFFPADGQAIRVHSAESVLLIKNRDVPVVSTPICEGAARKLYFEMFGRARAELDLPRNVQPATDCDNH